MFRAPTARCHANVFAVSGERDKHPHEVSRDVNFTVIAGGNKSIQRVVAGRDLLDASSKVANVAVCIDHLPRPLLSTFLYIDRKICAKFNYKGTTK